MATLIFDAGDFPFSADFAVAPGAVAHEGHEIHAGAVWVGAAGGIAFVVVARVGVGVERRAVAPGAEAPVGFEAAFAARAVSFEPPLLGLDTSFGSAPGARAHGLADGAVATVAIAADVELFAVAFQEFAAAERAPIAVRAGAALLGGAAAGGRLEGAGADAAEGALHLFGVFVALAVVDLERPAEKLDEVGLEVAPEAVATRGRPAVGPLGQDPGEHAVEDKAEGEDVGAEGGLAEGLFGGDVADRAGAGGLKGTLSDAGDAEVGEADPVFGEDDEVFGFDVAVHQALGVCVGGTGEHLVGELERGAGGKASLETFVECAFAKGVGDDEMIVDETRVLHGEDIGVIEPRREADFLAKIGQRGFRDKAGVGHFESHGDPGNGVLRAIDRGEAANGDAALDAVLAETLAHANQGFCCSCATGCGADDVLPMRRTGAGVVVVRDPQYRGRTTVVNRGVR